MPRLIPILFGAGFTIATCAAAGLLLLRRLRLQLDRAEELLFAFVSGAALVSTVVCLLSILHQARTGVFLALGSVLIGAGAYSWRAPSIRRKPLPKISLLYFLLLGSIFVLYFFNATAPEVSPDGSGYHLGNVIRTYEHHGFDWDYRTIYSAFPQGMEMLYLVAYALGGMPAAAPVHLTFLCVLAGLIICYARRFGFPRAGFFAAVLVFASPVIGLVGVSAYNDVAVATCIYAVFYLTEVQDEEATGKQMILGGLLSGFAVALKYTAWLVIPYALLAPGSRIKRAAAVSLTAAPWLIRNWLWLGNPVAPFLNKYFPNTLYTPGLETAYLSDLRHVEGFEHWWRLPLDLTLYGAKLPGLLGPVFLLAPLALLSLRFSRGRRLLAAAALFAVPFVFNPAARFLIPGIPFLALAMGMAMEHSPGTLPAVATFHALLALPAVMPSYCADWAWRIREMPVRVALGLAPEEPYIRRYVPDYPVKELLAKYTPKDQKIFSFRTLPAAYLNRTVVVGYESAAGTAIAENLAKGKSPKPFGIRYLLVSENDPNFAAIKQNMNSMRLSLLEQRNGSILFHVD